MRTALAFGLALALAPMAASATILDNSFETPDVTTATYAYNPTGTGWTFTNHTGIGSSGGPFFGVLAPDGVQAAFIQGADGYGVGVISQTITGLTVGDTYTFSYWQALRADGYGGNPLDVTIGGTDLGTFTPGSTTFSTVTTNSFVASSATALLAFTGLGGGSAELDTIIDNVTISDISAAVPEPASLLLLGVGLLGLRIAGRRKDADTVC